jgi:hypothetical protein
MNLMMSSDPRITMIREILGIPASVRWFELRVAVNELAMVKCEFIPILPDQSATELARFGLLKSDYS